MNKVFITAEAGVNHNGDMKKAIDMIAAAKEANVNAIKFQTFKSDELVSKFAQKAKYQVQNTKESGSQIAMLRNLELSYQNFIELKKECKNKNIVFVSTPFDKPSVDFLDELNIPFFKISSGDLTNMPFLKYISKKGRPIILSTGMASMDEVKESVLTIRKFWSKTQNKLCLKEPFCGENLILLHCTTSYPTKIEECNLNVIKTLKREFHLPIGYSDHTIGFNASIIAVSFGAVVIEKHFTLDKRLKGPDHSASLDVKELKQFVSILKDAQIMLGDGIKKPTNSEKENMAAARKSLVITKDMSKGEVINEDDIAVKRPAGGIEPKYYNQVVGATLKRDVEQDEILFWNCIKKK